jgi:Holliday junction DNA helicase RuvA
MVSYIIGKIVSINKKTITLENNYIGYCIIVSNLARFEVGKIKKLYIYKSISFNSAKNKLVEEMYGFENYEEKEFFLKLLQLQGIGSKTAINILDNDLCTLKSLIATKDVDSLTALKNITSKIANSIIDGIVIDSSDINIDTNNQLPDLIKAMKTLGYGNHEIEIATKLDYSKCSNELSDMISYAIKNIQYYGKEDIFKSDTNNL